MHLHVLDAPACNIHHWLIEGWTTLDARRFVQFREPAVQETVQIPRGQVLILKQFWQIPDTERVHIFSNKSHAFFCLIDSEHWQKQDQEKNRSEHMHVTQHAFHWNCKREKSLFNFQEQLIFTAPSSRPDKTPIIRPCGNFRSGFTRSHLTAMWQYLLLSPLSGSCSQAMTSWMHFPALHHRNNRQHHKSSSLQVAIDHPQSRGPSWVVEPKSI